MTKFTSSFEWPNGKGYTECTPEYADAMYEFMDTPRYFEDHTGPYVAKYENPAWHELDQKIAIMQMQGHIGAAHAYA